MTYAAVNKGKKKSGNNETGGRGASFRGNTVMYLPPNSSTTDPSLVLNPFIPGGYLDVDPDAADDTDSTHSSGHGSDERVRPGTKSSPTSSHASGPLIKESSVDSDGNVYDIPTLLPGVPTRPSPLSHNSVFVPPGVDGYEVPVQSQRSAIYADGQQALYTVPDDAIYATGSALYASGSDYYADAQPAYLAPSTEQALIYDARTGTLPLSISRSPARSGWFLQRLWGMGSYIKEKTWGSRPRRVTTLIVTCGSVIGIVCYFLLAAKKSSDPTASPGSSASPSALSDSFYAALQGLQAYCPNISFNSTTVQNIATLVNSVTNCCAAGMNWANNTQVQQAQTNVTLGIQQALVSNGYSTNLPSDMANATALVQRFSELIAGECSLPTTTTRTSTTRKTPITTTNVVTALLTNQTTTATLARLTTLLPPSTTTPEASTITSTALTTINNITSTAASTLLTSTSQQMPTTSQLDTASTITTSTTLQTTLAGSITSTTTLPPVTTTTSTLTSQLPTTTTAGTSSSSSSTTPTTTSTVTTTYTSTTVQQLLTSSTLQQFTSAPTTIPTTTTTSTTTTVPTTLTTRPTTQGTSTTTTPCYNNDDIFPC
jgi:hypothetical protein